MKESRGLGEGRAVLAVEKNNLAQVPLPTTATLQRGFAWFAMWFAMSHVRLPISPHGGSESIY